MITAPAEHGGGRFSRSGHYHSHCCTMRNMTATLATTPRTTPREPILAGFPVTIGQSSTKHGGLLVPDEHGAFDLFAAMNTATMSGNHHAVETLINAVEALGGFATRRVNTRLIPACDIGVSLRSPGRVLPYLFSNVVTCRRAGCGGSGATARRHAPQLALELDV